MGPRTFILLGNSATNELARRGVLLAPFAIHCSLSPLLSCIHSCLLLDWRHTVSLKFLDTQIHLISTEKLVLPRHACCVLSCLCCNENTAFFWVLISLGLAESKILPAAPVYTRLRTPLISFCTVQLWTLCTAHSLVTLSLYDLWFRPWGVARLLALHGLLPCPHPSEGVR